MKKYTYIAAFAALSLFGCSQEKLSEITPPATRNKSLCVSSFSRD